MAAQIIGVKCICSPHSMCSHIFENTTQIVFFGKTAQTPGSMVLLCLHPWPQSFQFSPFLSDQPRKTSSSVERPECGSALFSFWNGVSPHLHRAASCSRLDLRPQVVSPARLSSRSHLLQSLSHHPVFILFRASEQMGEKKSSLLIYLLCVCLFLPFLPLPVYMFCKGLEFLTGHNR